MEKLRWAYALGVICKNKNNELVAVRKDSPLIVDIGKDKKIHSIWYSCHIKIH